MAPKVPPGCTLGFWKVCRRINTPHFLGPPVLRSVILLVPSGLCERAEDKTGSPEGAAQVPSRVGSHCKVDILPDKPVTLRPPVMREIIGFWGFELLPS